MDVSKLVCHYHRNKEAMGVCSKCMKKLCLDCYLQFDDNTCVDCRKIAEKNNKSNTKKAKPITTNILNSNSKELQSAKVYRNNIIKITLEIIIGAIIGLLLGRFLYQGRMVYVMIVCLSLVPSFHFIHRIDQTIFGDPEHKGLLAFKYFIKIVLSLILSATLIGFVLSLFEIYLNASLLVKVNKNNK